jgi:polysaccharide pyruvyl transferase WcaK-like protein
MASFSEEMSKSCEVRFLAHAKTDERFVRDLKREHGLSIPVDAVYDMTPEESLSLIEASSVVIGMRGHAGMIPLGIGTPIISIISHKKLRFFLEDIGHSEWGVEASDDALAQKLIALTSDIVGDQQRYRAEISEAQDKLYDIVAPQNRKVKELIYNSASR